MARYRRPQFRLSGRVARFRKVGNAWRRNGYPLTPQRQLWRAGHGRRIAYEASKMNWTRTSTKRLANRARAQILGRAKRLPLHLQRHIGGYI